MNEKLQSRKSFKNLGNVYNQLAAQASLKFFNRSEEIESKNQTINNMSVVYKSQNLKLKTHLKEEAIALYQKTNE